MKQTPFFRRTLAACALAAAAIFSPRVTAADDSVAAADDKQASGVREWVGAQKKEAWTQPVEIVDADKLDTGGYVLVPSVFAPVFLTDPLGKGQIGQSSSTYGIGTQWRLGWMFRRVSVELLGGYAWGVGGTVDLPKGSREDLSFRSGWFGAQIRYTHTTASAFHPFVGAGGANYAWTAATMIRSPALAESVSVFWNPAVHALAGTFIRLGRPSSLFLEIGAQGTAHLSSELFTQAQLSFAPYVGVAIFGVQQGKD